MTAEIADTLDTDESERGAAGNASSSGMRKLRLQYAAVWQVTRSRWFRIASVVVLICLPILIGLLCRLLWSLPAGIAVANGPEGGFYEVII